MVLLNLIFFLSLSFTCSIIGVVIWVSIFHNNVYLLGKSILMYRLRLAILRWKDRSKNFFSPSKKIIETLENRIVELQFTEFSPHRHGGPGQDDEEVESFGNPPNGYSEENIVEPHRLDVFESGADIFESGADIPIICNNENMCYFGKHIQEID